VLQSIQNTDQTTLPDSSGTSKQPCDSSTGSRENVAAALAKSNTGSMLSSKENSSSSGASSSSSPPTEMLVFFMLAVLNMFRGVFFYALTLLKCAVSCQECILCVESSVAVCRHFFVRDSCSRLGWSRRKNCRMVLAHAHTHAHMHTRMHNRFTTLLDFVQDYLGEPER